MGERIPIRLSALSVRIFAILAVKLFIKHVVKCSKTHSVSILSSFSQDGVNDQKESLCWGGGW